MRSSILVIFVLLGLLCGWIGTLALPAGATEVGPISPPSPALEIRNVRRSVSPFNPQRGEHTEITFQLSHAATVTLQIFDPDFELVMTLLENQTKKAGAHKVAWDGKDREGKVVPDEAYFFTIEAQDPEGRWAIYDPMTFSGGEVYTVDQADFGPGTEGVRYQLAQDGRVLIRMGLHHGPLLRTLVDWQPRSAGFHTEAWDGQDEAGLIDLRNQANFAATIRYFTLPENVLITVGQARVRYEEYKARLKAPRPPKAERRRTGTATRPISPHFTQPWTQYRTPKIQMIFPEATRSAPDGEWRLEGKATVRVDMDPAEKRRWKDRKGEIYFFLDQRFLMEDGQAEMPYHFQGNFWKAHAGPHIVTANWVLDNDQVATVSQKILIKREPNDSSPK